MCLGTVAVIEKTWTEGGVAMATVEGKPVCLMYTPEASVGDVVLIHVGYAMEILDEERASQASALRREMAGLETRKETRR
jgi:hydrogenase expression/formation protein HypC